MEIRRILYGSPEYERQVVLREAVLRKPLGLVFTMEELGKDEYSFHFGAFAIGGKLLGCLILTPLSLVEMKMRQVAVDPEVQGSGVGRKLVEAAEEFARERDFVWLWLNARETSVPFYKALGYEDTGRTSIDVTLPHRLMEKKLSKG